MSRSIHSTNSIDEVIRCVLRNADNNGELATLAAAIGIVGGENELREIMNGAGAMNVIDRGMLSFYLGMSDE